MLNRLLVLILCAFLSSPSTSANNNDEALRSEKNLGHVDESAWKQASFQTSENGRRFAYVTQVGGKQAVVVDGNRGKLYDGIGKRETFFSPDSKRVAYVAKLKDNWYIVRDGVAGKAYEALATPVFSVSICCPPPWRSALRDRT